MLRQLVAANAPALHELELTGSNLHEEGLAPALLALQHNTHLRVLRCDGNSTNISFPRRILLPAVRGCASLREVVSGDGVTDSTIRKIMKARGAAATTA